MFYSDPGHDGSRAQNSEHEVGGTFSEAGRKPENQEETHTDTGRTYGKRHRPKLRTEAGILEM